LNLTFEVREGIIKHSRDYDARQFPELAEYLLDQRPPLEAQLIDLADEIAYNTADLDDGFEARLLTLDDIRAGVPLFERFYQEVDTIYPDAVDKLKFNETIKRMLDRLVGDLIRNTQQRLEGAGVHTLDEVRNHEHRLAALSAEVEKERCETKSFLYNNLYFSPSLAGEKDDAEVVIGALFTYWMEKPSALPHNYQDKAREEPLPRVICDYIAGMTDNYIYEQYEKFCAP
jgi:dGTPase